LIHHYQVQEQFKMKLIKTIIKLLLKADKWINYVILRGNKGEYISSRLGRHIKRDDCFACKFFCRVILLPLGLIFNKNPFRHCVESIQTKYVKK